MQAFADAPENAMKIRLPVDGSAYTKRMLGYIAAHDELLGPGHEYTLFTVVMRVPPHATTRRPGCRRFATPRRSNPQENGPSPERRLPTERCCR